MKDTGTRETNQMAIAAGFRQSFYQRELRIALLTACAIVLTFVLPLLVSSSYSQETPPAKPAEELKAPVPAQPVPGGEPAQVQPVSQDPATATPVIEETLRTIREVENLNKYIEQNKSLQTENQSLKKEIASLATQVKKLALEITTQNETLRKQLLTLPEFKVQSKVIGQGSAQAILDIGGKMVRIRENVEMTIPVENGVWTLIKVEKITNDVVELNFSELNRTITIYD